MNLYLIDTGILVGYARGAEYARYCHDRYDLSSTDNFVFTSVINEGEILALAEKNNWGGKKRELFNKQLNEFASIDISSKDVINAYSQIKAWTEGSIPPSATDFPPPQKPAIQMGQNDMWIAATAKAIGATLMTLDKDFDHLHHAGIIKRIWIDHSSR